MPTLPNVRMLGARPQPTPQRGIYAVQTGQVEQAAIEGARSLGQAGQAIANDAIQRMDEHNKEQDTLELAYAESARVQKFGELEQQLKAETDPNKIDALYAAGIEKIKPDLVGMVNNPKVAALYEAKLGEQFAVANIKKDEIKRARVKDIGQGQLYNLVEQQADGLPKISDPVERAAGRNAVHSAIGARVAQGIISFEEGAKTQERFDQKFATGLVHAAAINGDYAEARRLLRRGNRDKNALAESFARIESRGDPNAVNGKSVGLFQFQPDAARRVGLMGDGFDYRKDPVKSREAFDKLSELNRAELARNLGREPTDGEQYLAWQQGVTGATRLLNNPDAKAVDVVDDQAVLRNRGKADMTAREFAAQWTGKFDDGVSSLSLEQVDRLHGMIDREENRQRTQYRAGFEQQNKDDLAMLQQGMEPQNERTQADFERAYAPDQAEQKWIEYQDNRQFAVDYNAVQTMTPAQQAEMLAAAKPQAGAGFANAQKRHENLVKAVEAVNKERKDDPAAWGMRVGVMPDAPLDFSKPAELAVQLSLRADGSAAMAQKFGTDQKLLTKQDADQLSKQMQEKPAAERLQILKAMDAGIESPRAYQQTLQQIRPDSPVTAMAGGYLGIGRTARMPAIGSLWWKQDAYDLAPEIVAERLLQGEDLLNPSRVDKKEGGQGKAFPMPPEGSDGDSIKGTLSKFVENYGAIYAGMPQQAQQAQQAVRAYYAALVSRAGNYTGKLDENLFDQAMNDVLGKPVPRGDVMVLPPWGMSETTFNDAVKLKLSALAKDYPALSGADFDNIGLQNTPVAGGYVIRMGAGYLMDKTGKLPVIMNLNEPPR